MSLIPRRSDGLDPEENAATLIVEGEVEEQHRRALLRVARWRAAAIAERIFGVPLDHRVVGATAGAGFRGMLEFEVPFDLLDRHREREDAFTRAVRRDDFLGRMPLVYLFAPREADTIPADEREVTRDG